ncbi:MAG: HU family DNA-binding protein [Bacteroidota bacterium]
MTKAEIIQNIVNKSGVEKSTVTVIVEAFMATMKQSMIDGNNIYLRGFGTFLLKKRAEKKGRNIIKGTTVQIPAHVIPAFKPADEFESQVRSNVKVK